MECIGVLVLNTIIQILVYTVSLKNSILLPCELYVQLLKSAALRNGKIHLVLFPVWSIKYLLYLTIHGPKNLEGYQTNALIKRTNRLEIYTGKMTSLNFYNV